MEEQSFSNGRLFGKRCLPRNYTGCLVGWGKNEKGAPDVQGWENKGRETGPSKKSRCQTEGHKRQKNQTCCILRIRMANLNASRDLKVEGPLPRLREGQTIGRK